MSKSTCSHKIAAEAPELTALDIVALETSIAIDIAALETSIASERLAQRVRERVPLETLAARAREIATDTTIRNRDRLEASKFLASVGHASEALATAQEIAGDSSTSRRDRSAAERLVAELQGATS